MRANRGTTLLAGALIALALAALPAPAATAHAGSPAADHPGPRAGKSPVVRIAGRKLTLGADRRVLVELACSVRRGCRGKLRLLAARERRGKRARIGSAKFRLEGRRGSVSLKLRSKFASKVERRGKLRALGVATASSRRGRSRTTRRKLRIVPATPSQVAALHKIKADRTRLFDSVTGETFIPRGANYVRLSTAADGSVYHSTFEPGIYDPTAARAALDRMRADGYNTVRVFIDHGAVNGPAHGIGRGVTTSEPYHAPYVDNFADFARAASERGIYVLPSMDAFPQNDFYWDIVAATIGSGGTPNMDGRNLGYLDKGRVAAKAEYMKRFAAAMIERLGVPQTNVILAYQSDNEVTFDADEEPYDELTGTVTPLNGVTYDMAVPAQRQQSADASLVEYTHRLDRALEQSDPEALLTIGFFTNKAVGKPAFDGFMTHCSVNCQNGDWRYPGRAAAVSKFGAVDFLDIHFYPAEDRWAAAADLGSIESSLFELPFIIGEFGARKDVYGSDITRAAIAMRAAQATSCSFGAQGWLYWTFDTHEQLASQPLFFHLDESGGAINGQLAPIARPDPCAA